MADSLLKTKIHRLISDSGLPKSQRMLCPIVKVMQMRYRAVPKEQVRKAAKEVLAEEIF